MATEVDKDIIKNVHRGARVLLGGRELASIHKDFSPLSSTKETHMLKLFSVLGHQSEPGA